MKQIFYTANYRPDSRLALLLIHGAGGTHLHWPAELRTLSDATVYALDLPGHSHSPGPGCDTVEAYADVVSDVVEEIMQRSPVEHIALVGHSMGGAIALTLGLRNPAWLAGLVLVGTGARLRVADEFLTGLATDSAHTVDRIAALCWGPTVAPARVTCFAQMMRTIDPTVVHGDFVACNQFDVRSYLAQITVPTLIISADQDQMTPPRYGRFLADEIPAAEFALVANAGHMMALEHPLYVSEKIQTFVKKIDG